MQVVQLALVKVGRFDIPSHQTVCQAAWLPVHASVSSSAATVLPHVPAEAASEDRDHDERDSAGTVVGSPALLLELFDLG